MNEQEQEQASYQRSHDRVMESGGYEKAKRRMAGLYAKGIIEEKTRSGAVETLDTLKKIVNEPAAE